MLKARLVDELRKRQADLFALCSRLVQIPSENPPGDTGVLASFIRDYLASLRIPVEWHEPMAGRPNLVATLGSGAPNLVLSGHLDEFPAGPGWTRPPFSGAIEDGRVWGRGAGDMKAGLAVALTIASLRARARGAARGKADAGLRLRRGDGRHVGHAVAARQRGRRPRRCLPHRRVLRHLVGGHRREGRALASPARERGVGPRRVSAGHERGGGGPRRARGRRGAAWPAREGGQGGERGDRGPAPRRRAPMGTRHRPPRRHGGGERGDAPGRRSGQPDPRGRDGRGGSARAARADDGRDRARGPPPDRAGHARQGRRWTCSTSAIPT